ncbi:MAG: GNAT family N-acetyltransferase [Anaerolineae bacterium]|nr:GNAT family N-acetyltransferase [Anaerolineae bacterium]
MNIEFKRLTEVEKFKIIELMNHPLVRQQMPLTSENFDENDCDTFIAAKERLWAEYGYGPWAFVIDGQFVGWGGLQPENGEADLGLVLHPNHWGVGKALYDKIIDRAFGEMGFETVTVLFPPTRKRIKGLLRLGFKEDGELEVGGERFIRYRLKKI